MNKKKKISEELSVKISNFLALYAFASCAHVIRKRRSNISTSYSFYRQHFDRPRLRFLRSCFAFNFKQNDYTWFWKVMFIFSEFLLSFLMSKVSAEGLKVNERRYLRCPISIQLRLQRKKVAFTHRKSAFHNLGRTAFPI